MADIKEYVELYKNNQVTRGEVVEWLFCLGFTQAPAELLSVFHSDLVAEIRRRVADPPETPDNLLPGAHIPRVDAVPLNRETVNRARANYFWTLWKLHVHFYGHERAKRSAERLQKQAIDLAYRKGTEGSPDRERLLLYAAQFALLGYGPGAAELSHFEQDIDCYRNSGTPSWIVAEYDRFRGSVIQLGVAKD